MTKIITEHNERITQKTISIPFEASKNLGRIVTFDKVGTGNGGSTAFSQLPIPQDEVFIMVAPNKSVVKDKELQEIEKRNNGRAVKFYNGDKEQRFIYGRDSQTLETRGIKNSLGADVNGRYPDLVTIVVDSLLLPHNLEQLKKYNVTKILIDECHSVIQQSTFRKSLINFQDRVKEHFPNASIVSMTATPTLYAEVDFKLDWKHLTGNKIYHTRNQKKTIESAIQQIKEGKNVVVFSNDGGILSRMRKNKKAPLTAKTILGASLSANLFKRVKVVEDAESNLTLCSSSGFEGHDIWYKDAYVYFFENRSGEFSSFYQSNLKQASGRTRLGAKKITYCRTELANSRKDIFKGEIETLVHNFVNDKRYPPEQKVSKMIPKNPNNQWKKIPNIYLPYIHSITDDNGVTRVEVNKGAVEMYRESMICDKNFPISEYDEFWRERKVEFIYDDGTITKVNIKPPSDINTIKKNLESNVKNIEAIGLFQDGRHHIDNYEIGRQFSYNYMKRQYKKIYDVYIAEMNYNGKYNIAEHQTKIAELISFTKNKNDSRKNVIASPVFETLKEEIIELKLQSVKDKKGGLEDSENSIEEFIERSDAILTRLLFIFAEHKAHSYSKWTLHRDYNFLTTVPYRIIEHISKYLGISCMEIDIRSCNLRILYALNGKNLPNNIYGEGKKNKLWINTKLNDSFYTLDKGEKNDFKANLKRAFKNKGFKDDEVLDYYIENYSFTKNEYRGQFTSDMAFHEMNIITQLWREIKEGGNLNDGVIRRHDSLIIFNNRQYLEGILKDFKYSKLDSVKGWFVEVDYEMDLIKQIEDKNNLRKSASVSESKTA